MEGRAISFETKDCVDRLRANAKKLQNGDSADLTIMGRAISDLSFLMAHQIEAHVMTEAECEARHAELEQQLACGGRGINWPTASVILGLIVSVSGLLYGMLR